MNSFKTLQRRASHSTNLRGHRMRWSTRHSESRSIRTGVCVRCEMSVSLNTRPEANGIDISGEAVALTCTGDKGRIRDSRNDHLYDSRKDRLHLSIDDETGLISLWDDKESMLRGAGREERRIALKLTPRQWSILKK